VLAARCAGRVAALSEELNGTLAVPTDVTDLVQVRATWWPPPSGGTSGSTGW
jgi:hypothetical protein